MEYTAEQRDLIRRIGEVSARMTINSWQSIAWRMPPLDKT
jgi:hypothetical protein